VATHGRTNQHTTDDRFISRDKLKTPKRPPKIPEKKKKQVNPSKQSV
jgi:hypothetical protein